MKVNALYAIKNVVVFLILFYVDAQLLDKAFAAKGVSDTFVFLVSLFFMLAALIVHSHFLYETVTPKKEIEND